MDVQQVVEQVTATVIAATPTPVPPSQPQAFFPVEVNTLLTVILGGLVTFIITKIATRWQQNWQEKKDAEQRARERDKARDDLIHDLERSLDQHQQALRQEFTNQVNAINIAILRLERSIAEIEDYLEPIKDATKSKIRKALEGTNGNGR